MAKIQMATEHTTLVLNGTPIDDLGEGDYLELNYINPLTSQTNSSEGGVNINKRVDSGVLEAIVRVQKFSDSDIFLNSARNQAAPVIFDGSAKEDYIKDGIAGAESHILESGSITTQPNNTKNNTDGNAMMEYTIRFRNAYRNL